MSRDERREERLHLKKKRITRVTLKEKVLQNKTVKGFGSLIKIYFLVFAEKLFML